MAHSEETKKKIAQKMTGNNNSTKTKLFTEAMRRKMIQDPKRLDRIIENLFINAEAGDLQATKEILDRVDGKAVAIQEISGPDGNPIETTASVDFAKELANELLKARQKESK
jgi:hypothetical protein